MPEQKPQNIKPKETADPLPSWNDNNVKRSILDFVTRVSTEGGGEFVPPIERIAVFDNDGTLWCERPIQFQLLFALDRLDRLAADKTEMREQQPFKAFPRERSEDDRHVRQARGIRVRLCHPRRHNDGRVLWDC